MILCLSRDVFLELIVCCCLQPPAVDDYGFEDTEETYKRSTENVDEDFDKNASFGNSKSANLESKNQVNIFENAFYDDNVVVEDVGSVQTLPKWYESSVVIRNYADAANGLDSNGNRVNQNLKSDFKIPEDNGDFQNVVVNEAFKDCNFLTTKNVFLNGIENIKLSGEINDNNFNNNIPNNVFVKEIATPAKETDV